MRKLKENGSFTLGDWSHYDRESLEIVAGSSVKLQIRDRWSELHAY